MKLALQGQSHNFTHERLDELIDNCKQNKRESQKLLFDTFAGNMMTLCRRYAIDEQNAQDILQEGFINVFSNLSKFSNIGSFEGWMKKIFINT
jgi:RNA polymerase sigma-70 factor (ECF subfamily)